MKILLFAFFVLHFTHIAVTSHRKHLKRLHKLNDFRKDSISHLPQSKLLDIILNKAVSEIMKSVRNPDKRKQIALNQKEQVVDFSSLSDQLKHNLRSIKSRLKSNDDTLDPFSGQNDPYIHAEKPSALKASRKVSELVDVLQNSDWKEVIPESHNSEHNEFNKDNQELSINKGANEESFSQMTKKEDAPNLLFRSSTPREDKAHNRDKVSDILPVNDGKIELMKDALNNDIVKLDYPNVNFDVKLNSSSQRDKVVRTLNRVVNVLKELTFAVHDEINETTLKNNLLHAGDKRDKSSFKGLIKESSSSKESEQRLERENSMPEEMYPKHGSYVVKHNGNIFRIEKLNDVHSSIEANDIMKGRSNDEENRNAKQNYNRDSSEKENERETDSHLKPDFHEEKEKANEHDMFENTEEKGATEVKDAYVIKHGGQVFKVVQTDDANQNAVSSQEPKSLSNEREISRETYEEEREISNGAENSEEERENPGRTYLMDSERHVSQPLLSPPPKRNNDNHENTYEIKHNNKVFRITEITQPRLTEPQGRVQESDMAYITPVVKTDNAKQRGFNTTAPGGSVNNQYQQPRNTFSDTQDQGFVNKNESSFILLQSNEDVNDVNPGASQQQNQNLDPRTKTENESIFPSNQTINSFDENTKNYLQQPEQYWAYSKLKDVPFSDKLSRDSDDDYVTYVFKTKNSTITDRYFDTLNNTLNQDIIP